MIINQLRLFQVLSFVIGFGLLLWADWRIALGVLMTHWANNAWLEIKGRGT